MILPSHPLGLFQLSKASNLLVCLNLVLSQSSRSFTRAIITGTLSATCVSRPFQAYVPADPCQSASVPTLTNFQQAATRCIPPTGQAYLIHVCTRSKDCLNSKFAFRSAPPAFLKYPLVPALRIARRLIAALIPECILG